MDRWTMPMDQLRKRAVAQNEHQYAIKAVKARGDTMYEWRCSCGASDTRTVNGAEVTTLYFTAQEAADAAERHQQEVA